jgi:type II secretory ATPase GspE/PulE/Tfp pilus assembly ATPase PilB-like protein
MTNPSLPKMNDDDRAFMVNVSAEGSEEATADLIEHAVNMGASDLFIVANDGHYAAMVRHLGIVRTISILTPEIGKRVLGHIRAASGMEVKDRRPAEGRWIYEPDDDSDATVDLRLSMIPTLYGEDVAIRLLGRDGALFRLPALGMTPKQLGEYQQMIGSPSGLILITGPTGSGKTATLYATLLELNDGKRKINTIEDPVEYAVDGLRQSQTNPAIDLNFADLLKSVLRQNPDVVMIGEVRDAETALTAVRAANSGMLVLATLHAPNAASAIQSMRGYDIPSHFLSTSLRGVVSQRLVRTLDLSTRQELDITDNPHTFDDIKTLLKPGEGTKLYMPGPAESNHMSGYTGRTGVYEVMTISKNVRNLIAEGRPTSEISKQAAADGMLEFRQAALLKVAQGVTTTEEVFRVIPSEQLMMDAY